MTYWKNKVAVVTGGSSGLGRRLVEQLAVRGARVVAVARDTARLESLVDDLNVAGRHVVGWSHDVTSDESVAALFQRVATEFGQLDLLINCVGVSTRGAVLDVTPADYQRYMDLNFLTIVRCTRGAASLLESSRGHVVQIGSLASKSAAKFLGAYPPTKFAVAAYAQQLRYEWAEQGVHVLLVCPGPIARPDAGRRYDDQAEDLPEAARRPGGGVRLRGIDPAWLSQRILRACERRSPELVVPGKARLLFAIAQLWPRLGDWILRRSTRS